jgi:hypothetical protein
MGIIHAKVSTKPDPIDSSLIGKTDWNTQHLISDSITVPTSVITPLVTSGGGSVPLVLKGGDGTVYISTLQSIPGGWRSVPDAASADFNGIFELQSKGAGIFNRLFKFLNSSGTELGHFQENIGKMFYDFADSEFRRFSDGTTQLLITGPAGATHSLVVSSSVGAGGLLSSNSDSAPIYLRGGTTDGNYYQLFTSPANGGWKIQASGGNINAALTLASINAAITPIIQFEASGANQATIAAQAGILYSSTGTESKFTRLADGSTSFRVANLASAVNNLFVQPAVTTVAPILQAEGSDTNIGISYVSKGTGIHSFTGPMLLSSTLTFSTAAGKIIPGATSVTFRNNADSADNISIADGGNTTFRGSIIFSAATSRIIPGATSFAVRDNSNSFNTLLIESSGNVSLNNGLFFTVAGSAVITGGSASIMFRNNANNLSTLELADGGNITWQRDANLHRSATAMTNGAGASVGTLTNAPAATNPTKWLAVDDNGTTRYVPAW